MFRIVSKSASRAEILIYGDIGPVFWGDEVSAADFAKTLREAGPVAGLDIRINSYGGDVFDGLAIYRHLVEHEAQVTIHIDGIAASAASVIAMAGDTIRIAESGKMMIHDAWTIAIGNASELRDVADNLDSTSAAVADIYAARTGRSATELRDAMRAETWYTGAEAVAAKLATEIAPNKTVQERAKALAAPVVMIDPAKHKFKNPPPAARFGRDALAEMVTAQQIALAVSGTAQARRPA